MILCARGVVEDGSIPPTSRLAIGHRHCEDLSTIWISRIFAAFPSTTFLFYCATDPMKVVFGVLFWWARSLLTEVRYASTQAPLYLVKARVKQGVMYLITLQMLSFQSLLSAHRFPDFGGH